MFNDSSPWQLVVCLCSALLLVFRLFFHCFPTLFLHQFVLRACLHRRIVEFASFLHSCSCYCGFSSSCPTHCASLLCDASAKHRILVPAWQRHLLSSGEQFWSNQINRKRKYIHHPIYIAPSIVRWQTQFAIARTKNAPTLICLTKLIVTYANWVFMSNATILAKTLLRLSRPIQTWCSCATNAWLIRINRSWLTCRPD